jgi:transposase-like protein
MKLLLGTSCRRIVAIEEYAHSQAVEWWKEAGREIEILSKTSNINQYELF